MDRLIALGAWPLFIGGVLGLVHSVNGPDYCQLNNVKYVSFLNTSFRDILCLTQGSFNQKQVCGSKKSNITNMIILSLACPGNNFNTIYTHTCVSRTQLITLTPTLLWPETINSVIVTFRTLSLLQYRFNVFAQHFVIRCDHFPKFVRRCGYHLCTSHVVFDICHV